MSYLLLSHAESLKSGMCPILKSTVQPRLKGSPVPLRLVATGSEGNPRGHFRKMNGVLLRMFGGIGNLFSCFLFCFEAEFPRYL